MARLLKEQRGKRLHMSSRVEGKFVFSCVYYLHYNNNKPFLFSFNRKYLKNKILMMALKRSP